MKTKNCDNCKYSFPFEVKMEWNEKMDEALAEERVNNEECLNKKSSNWTFSRFPRYFWENIRDEYNKELEKKETYIECRCMPTFTERKKTDLCGQWQKKTKQTKSPCDSKNPDKMCDKCNCWKHTRAMCS